MAEDEDREFLLRGVRHSFDLIDVNTVLPSVVSQNHKSALDRGHETSEIVRDEIAKGCYVICKDWSPDIVSPLGLIPKSSGGYRLIHDCSVPAGHSVNDFTLCMDKCSYESVDRAVDLMVPECYMTKIDIKAAYRAVAINPQSYAATGLKWNVNGHTHLLCDTRLPFGARPSPTIFHKISQFIKRAIQKCGYKKVVAYQDDFLIIGDTYKECLQGWVQAMNIIVQLGFEINYDKLEPPSTCITFLGIELNSKIMTLSLPSSKLDSIITELQSWTPRSRATKRQLQSLAGKLNYAARVVRGGRTFLRQLLNCICSLQKPYHKARISGAMLQDIQWWQNYMSTFNGISVCIPAWDVVTIITDACGTGGGAFSRGNFLYVNWELDAPNFANLHINYKESAMAALSVLRWAPLLRNKTVYVYSDNQCAVSLINKCSSKCGELMSVLRQMFWASAIYNFHVKAKYLPGELNVIADTISRLHENGRLLQTEAIVNEWYLCHFGVPNAFNCVSLCNHMSLASLCSIFSQVQRWQHLRRRWMALSAH